MCYETSSTWKLLLIYDIDMTGTNSTGGTQPHLGLGTSVNIPWANRQSQFDLGYTEFAHTPFLESLAFTR